MAWGKAGSTTLTSIGDDLDITSMTANKFLCVMCQPIPSGNARPKITLNNDGGSNYARRRSEDGGSDTTDVSQTLIPFDRSPTDLVFAISYMANISTKEKLVITHLTTNNTNGAGNVPKRGEIYWKWVNTSDSITRIDLNNTDTGDFAVDSNISALGSNGALLAKPTDVPDNSILIEKDTAKRYWRTGASGLTEEQQLSNAELQDLNSGAKGMGEYVRSTSSKLYGKILTDIQFYLKKASPQAGAKVYARHYNSSDVLIHTYWEKLASDLPTSLTWTTETTLSGDTAFANGDYFIIEYTETDGTTATGAVQTNRKDSTNANQWDGSNSGFIGTYFGSSNYLDTGNMDIWFKGTTATAPTWTRGFFNPTDTTLFSSSSGWTGDTGIFTNSGDTMVWDTTTVGTAVVKTITNLSASGEWVMRFKITRVSGDANDGSFLTIGSSSASTSTLSRMQNGNGLYPYGIHVAYFANASYFYIGGSHDASFNWDFQSNANVTWSTGDSRWVEVSHASATAYTTKVYSNANFTGTPILTSVASPTSQTLDYDEFAIGTKWGGGRKNMIIEDMQIWDGVTSPP